MQGIFFSLCVSWHQIGSAQGGLNLGSGAYNRLVDDPSNGSVTPLVDSSSTDPLDSFLYRKITYLLPPDDTPTLRPLPPPDGFGDTGDFMPPPSAGERLTSEQIDTIGDWIRAGAPP